jgi:hypothetical protein
MQLLAMLEGKEGHSKKTEMGDLTKKEIFRHDWC